MGPTATVTYTDTRFDWQTESAGLVRVHWYHGDDAFGKRALAIGRGGHRQGRGTVRRNETKPVDFYVYADLQAFYGALGRARGRTSAARRCPRSGPCSRLITPDQIDASWVGIVIPHELTHLVFDTAIRNPYHFPPRWLNEGLASTCHRAWIPSDRGLVDAAVGADELIPLGGLSGQFPTRRDKFALAYAESASALDFMVRRYGRDSFVKLVQSYAGGVTDDAAFVAALGVDMAGFETAWLADIGADVPVAHGPKPDPVGPLPSGWSASPVTVPSGLSPVTGPTATPMASGPLTGSPSTTSAAGIGRCACLVRRRAPSCPCRRWQGRRAHRPRPERRPRWRPSPARLQGRSPTTGRWRLPRPSASRRCSPCWRWSWAVWAAACCSSGASGRRRRAGRRSRHADRGARRADRWCAALAPGPRQPGLQRRRVVRSGLR